MQLTLLSEDATSKTIEVLPVANLVHSRFNARRTREQKRLQALAERISRNGFEITRAPWAAKVNGHFEVFAGGTRFEAAKLAGLTEIPVVVHDGFTDEQIARLADEDNENDEYHERVPLLDVWAEYARLRDEEEWSLAQIAEAKGCDIMQASRRIKFHIALPTFAKQAVSDGLLDEGHCEAISLVVSDIASLDPWLTTEKAQSELTAEVLSKHRGGSAGVKPTVANVREAARRWKETIALAGELHGKLPAEHQPAFVALLAERKARTQAAVQQAHAEIVRRVEAEARRHEEELRRQQSQAEAARVQAEREARKAERVAAQTAKVVCGDARQQAAQAPGGIRLLLTDPPYGQAHQSGRRVVTAKKNTLTGDDAAACELLADVLSALDAQLADDAHLLIFTGWRYEPQFRSVIEAAGYVIKGSLIWVKHNHGTGDLEGAFAPKHERIIHAAKGRPVLRNRPADVLYGKDDQDSAHPTEKPRDLLRTLIEATTDVGQIVADPFAGSGSTLLAAMETGRDFWGCEVDEGWHAMAVDAVYAAAVRAADA